MIAPARIAKKALMNKINGKAIPKEQANSMDDIKRKAMIIGLSALGAGIVFLAGRRIYRKYRKNKSEKSFTPETQQAILLRSAMNPSGESWLMWMDGTKEKSINSAASQITNFKKVQKEYKNLYNRSLLNDLQKELDTEEYTAFMNIINSTGVSNPTIPNQTSKTGNPLPSSQRNGIKGKVIVIRKATKLYEKFTLYPFGSVKAVKPFCFINHFTTGKAKKIITGYSVPEFIEVKIKTIEGKVKTIYVSMSDVNLVNKEEFLQNYRSQYKKIIFRNNDFK